MNGTHLGSQNGVAFFEHFSGKFRSLVAIQIRDRKDTLCLPQLHGSKQTADTDADGTQVIDLVDLQHSVELVGLFQNLIDLVRGHRVQTAAKGVQLHQFQIVPVSDKFRRVIKPGMVHPLIQHPQGTDRTFHNRQTVLGKDIQSIGCDQLRDAVVDLLRRHRSSVHQGRP